MELRHAPYQRKKSSRKAKTTTDPVTRQRSNNLEWTPEEDSSLRDGVREYGGKNWKAVSARVEDRSPKECSNRWDKLLNIGTVLKRPWTANEDHQMLQLVEKYGASKWAVIASYLPERNGKQCRERWHNQLNPTITKAPWTDKENDVILSLQARLGNAWAKIAGCLPGRTDNSVKNHWHSSLKSLAKREPKTGRRPKTRKKKSRNAKARAGNKAQDELPDPSAVFAVIDEISEETTTIPVASSPEIDLTTPVIAPVDCDITSTDPGPLSPDVVSSVDILDLYTHAHSYQDGMQRAQAVINNVLDPMGLGSCDTNTFKSKYVPDAVTIAMTVGQPFELPTSWSASEDDIYSVAPISPAQPSFGLNELLYDSSNDLCSGDATGSSESVLNASSCEVEVARVHHRSTVVTEWGALIKYPSAPPTAAPTSVPSAAYVPPDSSLMESVDHEMQLLECGFMEAISGCATLEV